MKPLVAISVVLAGATVALADVPSTHDQIEVSRTACAKYWDIAVAKADGYEQLFDCKEGPHGNMGQHFIHIARATDGRLVLEEPDVLMYEAQPDGSMQLVAIEYVVSRGVGPRLHRPASWGRS
jgi:hypothetical protein